MRLRLTSLLALSIAGAQSQSLRVLSELQRLDPFGNILQADQAELPREVLSPALARNAFASFQAVVSVPAGQASALYIAQNPDHAVKVFVYNQRWAKRGETWIPDGLEPLVLADNGQVPNSPPQVPGQTARALWVDLWVRPDAPVRRTRLELQLSVGDQWIIYPMELRILSPVVPQLAGEPEALAPLEAPASESAAAPLRGYVCGQAAPAEEGPLSLRRLIRRNARQDVALARVLEVKLGKPPLVAQLLEAAGLGDAKSWCAAPQPPQPAGAEWYLKVRDFLYRTAAHSQPAEQARR